MKPIGKKLATFYFSLIVLALALLVFGNVVCAHFSGLITQYLCGFGLDYTSEAAREAIGKGAETAEEIERRGIVLLKNDGGLLPLAKGAKVNVFGWSGCDKGFVYEGGGSSVGSIDDKTSLMQGLRAAGLVCNEDLEHAYDALPFARAQDTWAGNSDYLRLYEPDESFYTADLMNGAKSFSDTAIVVIGRRAGEGRDLDKWQYDVNGATVSDRTYLELSPREELLMQKVTENFAHVIVLINAGNAMELGFLDDPKIEGAMYIGLPGNHGAVAIGEALVGDTTPSGHLVDTYAYALETAPSYVNAATDGPKTYNGGGNFSYNDYAEGIYVGYRWYETADAEGYWDDVENQYGRGYEGVVQFPFGYGMSYAEFEWLITDVSISAGDIPAADAKITYELFVHNVSEDYKGADVVQLYFTPPYTKGGIEKSAVELCAFAKTSVLEPGQGEKLTLEVSLPDLAAYDCYDRNNNNFMGYELDGGDYTLSLRTDAHTVAAVTGGEAEITFRVPAAGYRYTKDPVTGYDVVNRFTKYANPVSGAISNLPTGDPVLDNLYSIDGSDSMQGITYLTRTDFRGTFPQARAVRNLSMTLYNHNLKASDPKKTDADEMPATESKATEWTIKDLLGVSYDDKKWDELVSQLSVSELADLCANGGYKTVELKSILKPHCVDLDGPQGLTTSNTGADNGHATAYPSETILACSWDWKTAYSMGKSVGAEADALGVNGWYAPGANTHRSPFGGRNFEYYSEDGYLAGIMAAYEVRGCIENGLYCYLKHFAVNDSDTLRNGECRWLTEQALREIYLKPFELAVKIGGCNAMMSSVDRIGAVRASGNYQLLTEVLRNEWGFRGSVISDYYQDVSHSGTNNTHLVDEFVRAGNDLALDPSGGIGMFRDSKSATAIKAMQKSAKNILYTYANTQYLKATSQGLDLSSVVGTRSEVFPWWIPVLVSVDVVVVGGLTVCAVILVKRLRKKND